MTLISNIKLYVTLIYYININRKNNHHWRRFHRFHGPYHRHWLPSIFVVWNFESVRMKWKEQLVCLYCFCDFCDFCPFPSFFCSLFLKKKLFYSANRILDKLAINFHCLQSYMLFGKNKNRQKIKITKKFSYSETI